MLLWSVPDQQAAGSMAALHAAKGGAKTVLIEAIKLAREKLCGGDVNAWVIKRLDIPHDIIEKNGVCTVRRWK